jgi:hypothetical protein
VAKSKEKLEEEINATPFFSIKGDRMDAARRTAEYKLVENIWDYCKNYWFNNPGKSRWWFKEHAGEIDEAITNCLKTGNFNPQKGTPFINYLKRSISNEIKEAEKKNARETELINRAWHDSVGEDGKGWIQIEETKEGEEGSRLKNPARTYPDHVVKDYDPIIVQCILDIVEKGFNQKPEKRKPELRKYLTLEWFDLLSVLKAWDVLDEFGRKEFIDYEMLEKYKSELKLPARKSIAGGFFTKQGKPKTEQDASRTLNDFIKEIKPQLAEGLRKQGINFDKFWSADKKR